MVAADFNPRSPQGERQRTGQDSDRQPSFQSTLPAGGATVNLFYLKQANAISIHAPRRGSDGLDVQRQYADTPFQSTLPAGGATETALLILLALSISIHAPRRGSDLYRT